MQLKKFKRRRKKMKKLVIISMILFLSGCNWLVRERVVYRCPIPASLTQENRIDVIDVKTNEDAMRETMLLYEALGECTVDKNEIQTIINEINGGSL